MISHPNLDLIHRFFQAYEANDQAGIEAILSPAIQWHISGDHPLSGTKTGIAEVRSYFAQLGKAAFQASPIVMGVNEQYVIDCHQNWSSREGGANLRCPACFGRSRREKLPRFIIPRKTSTRWMRSSGLFTVKKVSSRSF